MNNDQTIKAATPIIISYFRREIAAEAALDLLGKIFKENSMTKDQHAGFRVTDRSGLTHNFPTAASADVNDDDRLVVKDAERDTLAIFNKLYWSQVERIAS